MLIMPGRDEHPDDATSGATDIDVRPGATCLTCGYSLEGLRPEGVCPECSTPVSRSIRPQLLRYAAPEFVANIVTGARALWFAAILSWFGFLLMGFMGMLKDEHILGDLAAALVGGIGGCVGLVVASAQWMRGWWRLAAFDTSVHPVRPRICTILRIATITQACCTVLLLILIVPAIIEVHGADSLAGTMGVGYFFSGSACMVAGTHRLRRIAQLFPNGGIARTTRVMWWMVVACIVLPVVAIILGPMVEALGAIMLGAAMLVWIGVGLFWPLFLRFVLRAAQAEAREAEHAARCVDSTRGG